MAELVEIRHIGQLIELPNPALDDYGNEGDPGQVLMLDEDRKRKWSDIVTGGSL